MSYQTVGSCPKCGAPIYIPSPYWSILPPPNVYSCNCHSQNIVTIYGHTVKQIENFRKHLHESQKFWKDEPLETNET